MQFGRKVRRSLYDQVVTLLQAPPAGTFNAPWNTLTEANMAQSTVDPTVTPGWPFIFVVDRNIRPKIGRLPLVVVGVTPNTRTHYELGSRNGHVLTMELDIFGNNRGNRDDLASFFQDNWPLMVNIKNYDAAGSPVIDTFEMLGEPDNVTVSLRDEAAKEGTLYNFNIVSVDGLTKL
jgi:hypothetical protein